MDARVLQYAIAGGIFVAGCVTGGLIGNSRGKKKAKRMRGTAAGHGDHANRNTPDSDEQAQTA